MKLLVATRFHPAIGGLETVMEILADEWTAAGHEVRVATDVPAPPHGAARRFPYEVQHRPSPSRLLQMIKWCDVYVQGCIGLKTLWPLIFHRRLYVATHHTWYHRADGSVGWQNHVKRWVSRYALNIAPSHALAAELLSPCTIIPNPYRTEIFKLLPYSKRTRDLIFVGRLVSDKGVTLLLQAVARLAVRGLKPSVTIVGNGPERAALERETTVLGIARQVMFTGAKSPDEVAGLLNQHLVFVVPSLWNEPFGVVALEGIACGCLVVGSQGGGLKDAVGPCGRTFPNGDVSALAEQLKTLLVSGRESEVDQRLVEQHLAKHRPAAIAKSYIDAILGALYQ